MLRTATYFLIIGIIPGTLLIIATRRSTQAQLAPPARYMYVFSPDARSVRINLTEQRVSPSLRVAELRSTDRVYPNPFGDDFFIQSSTVADQKSGEETEQLAVITRNATEPRLRLSRWLRGPTVSSSPIWAKPVNKNILLVSWQDEQGHISTVFHDSNTYAVLRTVPNFSVTPTTCLAADGQTVYAVSNNPHHEIKMLNLKSLAITSSSYDSVGSSAAYYKAPVAADGCTITFIERVSKPTQGAWPATIYLYDVEKRATLGKFNIEGEGRFVLALSRKLLLRDQTTLVPNKLPDGTTVGLRRVTTANVFVYDIETGKQIAQISVPKEGELAGVSSDGNSAYYISPNLLTVIDLVERRVTAKIDLPFSHGMLALGRSTRLD